ncbi:hypothetical protein U0070_003516 [Myodes glareolus]|uniref:Uncharacterized protein n=1 Tax=Myodes glareolus TaxID=447135 RepID=A0AAW0JVB9_MYOGA
MAVSSTVTPTPEEMAASQTAEQRWNWKKSESPQSAAPQGLEGDHTPKCLWSVKAYTNFGVERDTLNLETARKTKRMDEVITINILTNHSNVQRQDTVSLICPPGDGDFGPYWRHLHSIDALELKASMRGPGTDEDSLTEIILRTNLERREINRDTWELYDAGVMTNGTDAPKWINIMTETTKIFKRCKSYSPYDVWENIKEAKGEVENASLNLDQHTQDKPPYFADQLSDSMKNIMN